jgi:hypothetical protein
MLMGKGSFISKQQNKGIAQTSTFFLLSVFIINATIRLLTHL